MNKIKCAFNVSLIILLCLSCTSAQQRQDIEKKDPRAASLIDSLNQFNAQKPVTIKTNLTIGGRQDKKKFSSTGNIVCITGPEFSIRTNLYDFIFKSPLSHMSIIEKKAILHFPVEKTAVMGPVSNIDISNMLQVPFPFQFLRDFISGILPVIEDYRVIGSRSKGKEDYLLLENDTYYQTVAISKKKKKPTRIRLIEKSTGHVFEVYISLKKVKTSNYFKKLIIKSPQKKVRLVITFKNTRLNGKVKVKPVTIPRNTRVYKK